MSVQWISFSITSISGIIMFLSISVHFSGSPCPGHCPAWPGAGWHSQIEGEARGGAMYLCTYVTKINIKAAFLNVYVHPSYVSTITIHYNNMIVSPRLAVITDWAGLIPGCWIVVTRPRHPGPRANLIRSRRWSGHWKTWGWFPSPLLSHITALLVTIITKRSLHLQTALWHISIRT